MRISKGLSRMADRLFKRRPVISQAGCIVLRCERGDPEVLVVSSRRRRDRWVLPKGKLKKSESASDAALRELREEAGVRGRLLGPAGVAEYPTRDGRVRIEYFLIEYRGDTDDREEDRIARWCDLRQAARALSHSSARAVLRAARPQIDAYAQGRGDSRMKRNGARPAR